MKFRASILVSAALLTIGLVAQSTPALAGTYDDPYFLNWPTFVPSIGSDYTPSTENDCTRGQTQCVDKVIRDMTKRYNSLGCAHNSAFAFTYLLTTEEYRNAIGDPNFFSDNAFINHQDAVFGDYYFEAYDNWTAGRVDQVSPSWRIAFDAADKQQVSGIGNILLGMNAHVNRDLPFVLAAIGLTKPDGTSRKPDHDKVNVFLNQVNQYLLNVAAAQLDPTIDDGDVPGVSIDNSTAVQLLTGWREEAWHNAERLVNAPDAAARQAVAQDIENSAAYEATVIKASFSYNALSSSTAAARNSFCLTHRQPH